MARFIKQSTKAQGQIPGSMVFIGAQKVEDPWLELITYNEQHTEESRVVVTDLPKPGRDGKLYWLNVVGLHDIDLIRTIGREYGLHPLVMESLVDTGQRPNMEEFDDCIFLTMKMMRYLEKEHRIIAEQISIVIKEGLVITFQEEKGDVFEPIRDRMRNRRGRVLKSGSDYLAFALLDLVFDQYIVTVERFGEQVEELEAHILTDPTPELLALINQLKLEVNFFRKHIRPTRELAGQLAKLDSPIIRKQTIPFLKDLVGNASQAAEVVETYANMLSDFLQVYHSAIGNRANDVMKVLTIFAAIFIPLTFLAGVYGTNFDHIPELSYKYSYPIFWGVLIITGLLTVWYFRRKGWL